MVHNTSHFLKVIKEMAVNNDSDAIYKLVKELDESFGPNIVKVYSNYSMINILLTEAETKAQKLKIKFDAYVEQGINLERVSDMDIISMIGNLLDNAITAASKKTEKSLKKVRIFMQNEGNICVIKIVNDYVGRLLIKAGKLLSTKAGELHGIGMTSINKTAHKYDGYLEYYTENDKFIAVLVLPAIGKKQKMIINSSDKKQVMRAM